MIVSFREGLAHGARELATHLQGLADKLSSQQSTADPNAGLKEYVLTMPSAQNAVDAVPGWNMALPPEAGATAGVGNFYLDQRIAWVIQQMGSVKGLDILELGPLEASHTYMLQNAGARSIDAIEANRLAFLRCLIVKELLNLDRAHFHLGNFVEWLQNVDRKYDLIVASGILYHMENPIELIELMARRSDNLFLWTHYWDDEQMPASDYRRHAFTGVVETVHHGDLPVKLYQRSYHQAWKSESFCGGMRDIHRWIDRSDLLKLLAAVGFDDVRITMEEPRHENGPSFSVFARRTPTAKA
ncbi:tRNA mo(5)U34 methyltransferase [Hartmannibacter diazotrophicus]|uniref:tRNA mo(5)U34 methyltransferase n=1 Tax=Hartmannibacter diazotrophicus TaxID=1482074 RepID=A0A2C9D2E7_9HYPH|nr:class I SAM-dependent methyltransferase [Hartmannibacter diazotrophicus]SON54434.1 tRNA mo(5)U34 methyltransferase [Hartmannibacter diazotrophicus]